MQQFNQARFICLLSNPNDAASDGKLGGIPGQMEPHLFLDVMALRQPKGPFTLVLFESNLEFSETEEL